jgi:hypothetical protein
VSQVSEPSPALLAGPHPDARDPAHGARGARRRARLAGLAGLAAVTGYVYSLDPDKGGVYPQCPSRVLFGIDCPACGGLRGTNALLRGRIAEALDHNLLLPAYLSFIGLLVGLWLLPLIGRPARTLRPPGWLLVGVLAALGAFTVLRNLPIPALQFLASDA